MAGEFHNVEFCQAIGKPSSQTHSPRVVEFAFFYARAIQDTVKLSLEVIYWAFAIFSCPSILLSALLYEVIAVGGHEHIDMPLWLSLLMLNEQLCDLVGQR